MAVVEQHSSSCSSKCRPSTNTSSKNAPEAPTSREWPSQRNPWTQCRPRAATLDNTMGIGRPASLGNTLTRECSRGLSLRGRLRYYVISVFPDLTEPMALAAILTIRDGAIQEHAKNTQQMEQDLANNQCWRWRFGWTGTRR